MFRKCSASSGSTPGISLCDQAKTSLFFFRHSTTFSSLFLLNGLLLAPFCLNPSGRYLFPPVLLSYFPAHLSHLLSSSGMPEGNSLIAICHCYLLVSHLAYPLLCQISRFSSLSSSKLPFPCSSQCSIFDFVIDPL